MTKGRKNKIKEVLALCEETSKSIAQNETEVVEEKTSIKEVNLSEITSNENVAGEDFLLEEVISTPASEEVQEVETTIEEQTEKIPNDSNETSEEVNENTSLKDDSAVEEGQVMNTYEEQKVSEETVFEGTNENFDIEGNPVVEDEELPHELTQGFTEEFPSLETISMDDFSLTGINFIPEEVVQETLPPPTEIEDPIFPMEVELTEEEIEEANRANNELDNNIATEEFVAQKKNHVPETNLPELEIVPLDEENQPYSEEKSTSGEISSAMEEDEETVIVVEEEVRKPKMKIKEIKYGMTVIANLGNYENIRTHIEATAEIEENEDLVPSIKELSTHIRKIGREEYREIKDKTKAKEEKAKQQSRPHTGNHSQLGNPQQSRQPNQQPNQQSRPQINQQSRGQQGNYPPRNNQHPPAQHGQRIQRTAPNNQQHFGSQPNRPHQNY